MKNILRIFLTVLLIGFLWQGCSSHQVENPLKNTYCNPVNIEYNFWRSKQKAPLEGEVSHREAADPCIVVFKNEYYLFASHSGGYWWSADLVNWNLVTTTTWGNVNGYAPSAMVMGDSLYITGNGSRKMYVTANPKGDEWKYVNQYPGKSDPCLFLDDDGKVYLYHGLTKGGPIEVVELDPVRKFEIITGTEKVLFYADAKNHGCESPDGSIENKMAFEGAWMTKHEGKYYLDYAVPGTSSPLYNDASYVSDSPNGPFTYCINSPTSFKPAGFVNGSGHSSTFKDLNGNYWHVSTSVLSQLYRFERRIALYPLHFDADGYMYTNTYLGDYPQFYPHNRPAGATGNFAGAMLLSVNKPVESSSSLTGFPALAAVDENMKTWWSAASCDKGEWLLVNLEQMQDVAAIQINFAEQDIEQIKQREPNFSFAYTVECAESANGPWEIVIDKTNNPGDLPHDYVPLHEVKNTQYLRITNQGKIPAGGRFAIRGFRVFGFGLGDLPTQVEDISINRYSEDLRKVDLTWKSVDNADGYIIRFGIAPDKLYNHYQILDGETNKQTITTLNVGVNYFFSIDAYNANGISKGRNTLPDNSGTDIESADGEIPGRLTQTTGGV